MRIRWCWPLVMVACSLSIAASQSRRAQVPLTLTEYDSDSFDWNIASTQQLRYKDCYGGFQCARLDVPLNWNASKEAQEKSRAAVAVIRLPAKVPVTHKSYGGIILVNPGGPGESGIDQVLSRGRSIQTIVDAAAHPTEASSSAKYFDIVGFDPRGVKYTTPSLTCFPDAFSQQMWLLTRPEYSHMYDSSSSFALEWARTEALGRICSAKEDDTNMVRFANTAQVVQDMVEIIERHGEWRQNEANEIVAQQKQHSSVQDEQATIARTAFRSGHEMLQYWGVSYGTLLGQTFAAMHPNRVGKLIIDGVLDPEDYYNGGWLANLQDSDKVMSQLCEYCFRAGPSKCPLFTGSSAGDIERLVEGLVVSLKENPIIAWGGDASLSDSVVVTFDDYYLRAINAMANPFTAAEDFFRLLAQLRKGNVSEVAASKQAQLDVTASLASCRTSSNGCMPEQYFGLLGSTPAIECMDSAARRHSQLTKAEFNDYFKELSTQSHWFSPSWARHRMSCIGMNVKPAWTFNGSITANTSHPLLIIGSTLDTVTPLRNAQKVAALFPGSVVLQQDSEGHCSHANPSLCTARRVRQYFQKGELPGPGTVCEPDWRPFIGNLSKVLKPNTRLVKDDDRPMLEASIALAQELQALYDL